MVSYHAQVEKDYDFTEFTAEMCEAADYIPLISTTRQALGRRLTKFDVALPDLPQQQEALVPKDGSELVLLRLHASAAAKEAYLEFMGLGEGAPPKLESHVQDVSDLELMTGPVAGAWKTARLHERLGEPGYAGSPLANREFRTGLRHLYQDGVRRDLRELGDVVGSNPIPISRFEQLEAFQEAGSILNRMLQEASLLRRNFVVTCRSCGPLLSFRQRERAKQAVSETTGRCAGCGEQTLTIVENCALTEGFVDAMDQGLWLTALAAGCLSENCWSVWPYRSPLGVDLMTVYLDQTLFIACRDRSVTAQNMCHTLLEARQMGADICVILSSEPLSGNVRSAAARTGSSPSCRIVGETEADALRQGLNDELLAVRKNYIGSWLAPSLTRATAGSAGGSVTDLVSKLA